MALSFKQTWCLAASAVTLSAAAVLAVYLALSDTPEDKPDDQTPPDNTHSPDEPNEADLCIQNEFQNQVAPRFDYAKEEIRTANTLGLRLPIEETINSIMGIAKYRFETCEETEGMERSDASDKTMEELDESITAFREQFAPQ